MLTTMDTIERYLRPLLYFARDEIRAQEALGRLEPGQLRSEEMVDEALLDAMHSPEQPPRGRMYPWLRGLVRRAVERQVKQHPRHRSPFEPVGEPNSTAPRRLIERIDPTPEQLARTRARFDTAA